jgi:NADPH:quinone reductase-like Zn-dependent oxidoreductase
MKAVGIKNGKGNADAFFIEDNVPDPVATAGRILVGIKAFGLNRMDIMQREDKYPYPLLPESGKILGVEFSGLVEAVGPDCGFLTHYSLIARHLIEFVQALLISRSATRYSVSRTVEL